MNELFQQLVLTWFCNLIGRWMPVARKYIAVKWIDHKLTSIGSQWDKALIHATEEYLEVRRFIEQCNAKREKTRRVQKKLDKAVAEWKRECDKINLLFEMKLRDLGLQRAVHDPTTSCTDLIERFRPVIRLST